MDETDLARIRTALDKSAAAETVDAYFRALDERNFDTAHFASIFMPDGVLVRPNDTVVTGPAEIAASHAASFARFESTQHLLTGHSTSVVGDTADVRVNLVAMHLWPGANNDVSKPENYFVAGAVITVQLARADGSWKIASVRNVNVWRGGAGFATLAQIDKR